MKIVIVGATGLVGSVILKVLEEARYISLDKISAVIPVASEKSVGKDLFFNNMPRKIVSIEEAIAMKPEIAIFSAGAWDRTGQSCRQDICRNAFGCLSD